jgi:hypothetical protein
VLSWSAPVSDGGASIRGYDVYEATSPGHERPDPVAATLGSGRCTISELRPGIRYYFVVRAFNQAGPGESSNQVSAAPDQPPAITSASKASFTTGRSASFTVRASGFPSPELSESGKLPKGIVFKPGSRAAGTLSGAPGTGTAGTYRITLTAANGIGHPADQSFVLTVVP